MNGRRTNMSRDEALAMRGAQAIEDVPLARAEQATNVADRTASDVMIAMVSMFSTGDVSAVKSTVSDAYVDHQGVGSGEVVGADGFSHVVGVARGTFAALDVSIEDLFAAADRAVARLRWRGTLASGAIVERETLDIVRIIDGLAVEHWGGESWSTGPTAGLTHC